MLTPAQSFVAGHIVKRTGMKEYLRPIDVAGTYLEPRLIRITAVKPPFVIDRTHIQKFVALNLSNDRSEPE